jgi:hypothetical protein
LVNNILTAANRGAPLTHELAMGKPGAFAVGVHVRLGKGRVGDARALRGPAPSRNAPRPDARTPGRW